MARGVKRKLGRPHEHWHDTLANQAQSLQGPAEGATFWRDVRPVLDSTAEGSSSYSVEFMESDLCNILLSEGIH